MNGGWAGDWRVDRGLKPTVRLGTFGGWMAPRAEAQATVGGIILSRAGRDDDYSNTTRNPSVL